MQTLAVRDLILRNHLTRSFQLATHNAHPQYCDGRSCHVQCDGDQLECIPSKLAKIKPPNKIETYHRTTDHNGIRTWKCSCSDTSPRGKNDDCEK